MIKIFIDYAADGQKSHQKARGGESVSHGIGDRVKVPKIYWDLTRRAVLTMEWIDGIKLTDEISLKKARLNRRELIDQVIAQESLHSFVVASFNGVFTACVEHKH